MFDLSVYAGKHICVAVSGGRDSMALINFIYTHMREHGITLSALNCDHGIRGSASARDSAFVKDWCDSRGIPLMRFEWNFDGVKTENNARVWRRECYGAALLSGADYVATAHHMNDNAETVLFNLARGASVSGLVGILDGEGIIHPLIGCSRKQIDEYIAQNGVPFVDDETNFSDCYTRNKIRHNVLPSLESAVPGAVANVARLSRLALEDEKYFRNIIAERGILRSNLCGVEIYGCEPVIFKRAAVMAIKKFGRVDYTAEHLQRLQELINFPKNKKFEFLGLTAYAGEGKIVLTDRALPPADEIPFAAYDGETFLGIRLKISRSAEGKSLKFDVDRVPKTAVIRFMRGGDRFCKFGGGTKKLGDYFTDRKIPLWARCRVPLIADGSDVLAVCGVEISDKVKVTDATKDVAYITSEDFLQL